MGFFLTIMSLEAVQDKYTVASELKQTREVKTGWMKCIASSNLPCSSLRVCCP